MKPVPSDPYAFQVRVMDALIGDIWDVQAKGTPRLDALRAASRIEARQGRDTEEWPDAKRESLTAEGGDAQND